MEEIVTETNNYADKFIMSKGKWVKSRLSQMARKSVTVIEIYGMLWVFMLMGIAVLKKPTLWSLLKEQY
jgi:hypothetical protein